MEEIVRPGLSSSVGVVPGPYLEESMVCQYTNTATSQGSVWFGDDPFAYSTPVLFAQFILIFLVTRTVYFFLKPFRQSMMSAQLIAGIIMGPSFLARDKSYSGKLLSPEAKLILNTVADVGFMFHLFLLGVQIDVTMLRKAGRNAAVIGTSGFALAIALGVLAMVTLPHMVTLDEKLLKTFPIIVTVSSISSFPVITSLLADLNILNSEMGRLATFTSMVIDLWSYFVSTAMAKVGVAVRTSQWGLLWSIFWIGVYVIVVVFVLRPLILTIAKMVPEGKPIKGDHLMSIIVILLWCGFCSDVLGQHSGLGSFILGMVIPDGPPLGETLVYKLEAMTTGLLLPAKLVITGLNADMFSINSSSAAVVELIIIFTYVGKFLGTLVAALYYSVPLGDAISLALVMCCKGIVDIAVYCILSDEGKIDEQEHALLMVTLLIVTGIARTLVGHLYDPSRRYMVVENRCTIQDSRRHNNELRMLVCIHKEHTVPTLINLLEASNPTKRSPISVIVLNLVELKGRASAILVPDFRRGKLTSTFDHSKHIVNAFGYYADDNRGRVILQHFTAVAPYPSMHDDICMLALDKNVTIVIVPFHKQWAIDGKVGAIFPSIRTVNRNVINKAPCSVGVLVDRSQISGSWSVSTGQSSFRVALLFLGGVDDREALAYGRRMSDHPNVILTVVWIRLRAPKFGEEMEDDLDVELMNDFRESVTGKKRIVFKEKTVEDAVGTTRVIHSMEDRFELFIVGRHHEPDSSLTSGLTEWSECPELGVVGDMLATWDFQFSVLVVQQQPIEAGFLDPNLNGSIGSRSAVGSRVFEDHSSV